MDSVGEGEGGKIWENGIETCKISCMKWVAARFDARYWMLGAGAPVQRRGVGRRGDEAVREAGATPEPQKELRVSLQQLWAQILYPNKNQVATWFKNTQIFKTSSSKKNHFAERRGHHRTKAWRTHCGLGRIKVMFLMLILINMLRFLTTMDK